MLVTFIHAYTHIILSGIPDSNGNISGVDGSQNQITDIPVDVNNGVPNNNSGLGQQLIVIPVDPMIVDHDNKTVELDKKEVNSTEYKLENESVDNNDNNIIINININKNDDEKDNSSKHYTYHHGPRQLGEKLMASKN
ncbi:unnamed protein product [Schistosoma margrebowiei]|uniref:Uncharacterized protein n=1 Tax=Schistosoma margrebowiei TaxID=48269 RepID=A0A183MCC6_9TREM|nr:unnamed protein product [Schistosoma margrebowiei]